MGFVPAYLILFWLFGFVCGGVVIYARFRYATEVANRLSGKNSPKNKPFLSDETKYAIVIALSVIAVILAIAIPISSYFIEKLNQEERIARMMVDEGYVYMPTQLAGWKKTKEDVSVRRDIEDMERTLTSENSGHVDLSPGEAFSVHEEMKENAKKLKP